jgi:hypothetical protein
VKVVAEAVEQEVVEADVELELGDGEDFGGGKWEWGLIGRRDEGGDEG